MVNNRASGTWRVEGGASARSRYPPGKEATVARVLWVIALLIVGLWLAGVVLRIAGNFIHLLLLVAALVVLWNLFRRRRAV
jgi:hypothetical protein